MKPTKNELRRKRDGVVDGEKKGGSGGDGDPWETRKPSNLRICVPEEVGKEGPKREGGEIVGSKKAFWGKTDFRREGS